MDSLDPIGLYFVRKDLGVCQIRGMVGNKHLLVDSYDADVRDNGEVHIDPEPQLTVIPVSHTTGHKMFKDMGEAVNFAREYIGSNTGK